MKKSLNKSSKSNQLSTFFDLYASCGCGPCGCSCGAPGHQPVSFTNANQGIVESGYRSALQVNMG